MLLARKGDGFGLLPCCRGSSVSERSSVCPYFYRGWFNRHCGFVAARFCGREWLCVAL